MISAITMNLSPEAGSPIDSTNTRDETRLRIFHMNAYFARFRATATNKPKISSLSQEFGFLILILCLASFEAGCFLEDISFHRTEVADGEMNLALIGMLLINWLASQFQWSQRTTLYLRMASVFGTIGVSILICWHIHISL
jgi:hypothetical protein